METAAVERLEHIAHNLCGDNFNRAKKYLAQGLTDEEIIAKEKVFWGRDISGGGSEAEDVFEADSVTVFGQQNMPTIELEQQAAGSATTKSDKPKADEERFTDEFNADEKIRVEFGGTEGLKDYLAFRKYESQGRARVIGGTVVKGEKSRS